MESTKLIANWVGGRKDNGEYVVMPQGWHSADGDNWTDNSGRPVVAAEFEASSITLNGGFRDGDVVG